MALFVSDSLEQREGLGGSLHTYVIDTACKACGEQAVVNVRPDCPRIAHSLHRDLVPMDVSGSDACACCTTRRGFDSRAVHHLETVFYVVQHLSTCVCGIAQTDRRQLGGALKPQSSKSTVTDEPRCKRISSVHCMLAGLDV